MAHTAAALVRPLPGAPPSGAGRAGGAPCANCEAPLVGPYCAACGQREAPGDPSLRELLTEAFQELVNVDGKLLVTLRALLRPGRLTAELAAGRRARYVSPVRVYLACSVLLFAVLAAQPDRAPRQSPNRFQFFGGVYSFTFTPDSTLVAGYERGTLRGLRGAVQARMMAAVRGGPEAHARLEQAVTNALPQAVFLLVPVYALLVAAAHRGAGRRYPRHLNFALHLHAFVFLALAALFAVRAAAFHVSAAVGVPAVTIAMNVAILGTAWGIAVWIAAYVAAAYRRTYGGGWAATAVRLVALHAVYWAVTAAAMLALLLLVVLRG